MNNKVFSVEDMNILCRSLDQFFQGKSKRDRDDRIDGSCLHRLGWRTNSNPEPSQGFFGQYFGE